MDRNFWRDLYPVSETRRRFARRSLLWIYLPVGAAVLLAVAAAAALLVSGAANGSEHDAQMATVVLAAGLLAAGFVSWLAILISLWGIGDALDVLPALGGRVRLRFVSGARMWKRGILSVKRTVAAAARFFSPAKTAGIRMPPGRTQGRKEKRDEQGTG